MDIATADKLHEVLTRLYGGHEQLLQALQLQQQAIRRFDAPGLEKLRDRCEAIAQRISELEEARARIAGPGARMSELAAGLPEPQRSRLAAISAGLRKLAIEITSVSRVNNTALQNMLNHFHTVYQMIASTKRASAYNATGQSARPNGGAFLVDAVA